MSEMKRVETEGQGTWSISSPIRIGYDQMVIERGRKTIVVRFCKAGETVTLYEANVGDGDTLTLNGLFGYLELDVTGM